MITLKDPHNPASPRLYNGLESIGDSFRQWMNKPVKRVQVYTWRVAANMADFQHDGTIRFLKPYRTDRVNLWRNCVAAKLRIARRQGSIALPVYNEAIGAYDWDWRPA